MMEAVKSPRLKVRVLFVLAAMVAAIMTASGSGPFLGVGPSAAQAQSEDRTFELDEDPKGNDVVSGELIVSYKEGVSAQQARAAEQAVGAGVQDEIPDLKMKLLSFPDVKNERAQEAREQALEKKKAALENNPNVRAVSYNSILQLAEEGTPGAVRSMPSAADAPVHERTQDDYQLAATPGDPLYGNQWAYPKINAPQAWDTTEGSSQTKVAVLDSGVQANHPDLQGKVVGQYDFFNNDATAEDDVGHGTHVAGTVAANTNNGIGVAGTCPNCTILAGKVGGLQGVSMWAVTDGIIWATNNGAKVINMSLGSTHKDPNQQIAVNYAWNSGVFVVAAMMNEAQNGNPVMYPAAYDNVMGVANTTQYDQWNTTSNHNAYTDVAAPGTNIYSTLPGSNYGYKTGTSMATPHVAGLAGLIASQGKSNSEIKSKIETTAVDLGTAGWDEYFGRGRINAQAAVAEVTGAPTITSSFPAPYQKRMPTKPVMTVNFSEAMDKSTLTDYNIELYKYGQYDTRRSITVVPSPDGKSVGFFPNTALKKGKVYEIVLWKDETGIKDLQGTALVGNTFYEAKGDYVHWIFKTRPR